MGLILTITQESVNLSNATCLSVSPLNVGDRRAYVLLKATTCKSVSFWLHQLSDELRTVKPWSALLFVSTACNVLHCEYSLRVEDQVLAHDLHILSARVDSSMFRLMLKVMVGRLNVSG